MSKRKDIKTKRVLLLAIAVVLVIGICSHFTNDYYVRNFIMDKELKAGEIQEQSLTLEKGKYEVVIQYKTDSPNNYFMVSSNTFADTNNQKGIVFGKAALEPSLNQMVLPITIEKICYDAKIEFFCTEGTMELSNLEITSTKPYFTDSVFLAFIIILLLACINRFYPKFKTKEKKVIIKYAFLIAAVILASLPYFNDFLIRGHDVNFHLAHIEGIACAIKNGEIPIRINSLQTNGYGYAMPIMYPNLFLYLPALLRIFGVSLMLSYKSFLVLINIATVCIAYKSFRNLLQSEDAAMYGSVLYTLGAYRFLNIYERGALGEVLAMTFLPLVLWGLYEVLKGNSKKWIWLSAGLTGVLMSHVITTFMVALFSAAAVIIAIPCLIREKKRIGSLFIAGAASIGMTLWFFVPMLSYMRLPFNVMNENKSLHDSSLYLFQMFLGFWGIGERLDINAEMKIGEMPVTLGPLITIGICLFLLLIFLKKKKENRSYGIAKYMLIMGLFAVFMASWAFPWEALQKIGIMNTLFSKIQYSMRFLMPATLFLSIVSAVAIASFADGFKTEKFRIIVLTAILLLGGSYLGSTLEKDTIPSKSDLAATLDCDNLYYYEGMNPAVWKENGESILVWPQGAAQISEYVKKGSTLQFDVELAEITGNTYMDVPLAYYPGYTANLEKEVLAISMAENGMVRVQMPEKSGTVKVSFDDKPLWKIANIISVITWVTLAAIGIKLWRKKKI